MEVRVMKVHIMEVRVVKVHVTLLALRTVVKASKPGYGTSSCPQLKLGGYQQVV
jgi:hypothetical protein